LKEIARQSQLSKSVIFLLKCHLKWFVKYDGIRKLNINVLIWNFIGPMYFRVDWPKEWHVFWRRRRRRATSRKEMDRM